MHRVATTVWAAVLLVASPTAAQTTQTSSAPAEPLVLAAEMLRHGAEDLIYTPAAPSRAERIVTLVKMADRLAPGEPRTNRLFAFIYRSLGNLAGEAQAVGVQLAAHPRDYNLWLQWLSLRISQMETLEERVGFLEQVLSRSDVPDTVKAYLQTQKARALQAQQDTVGATSAIEQAIRLDPNLYLALQTWHEIRSARGEIPASRRAASGLAMLYGKPFDVRPAYELGVWVNQQGLHEQAVEILEHVYQTAQAQRELRPAAEVHALTAEYFNALLDAKHYVRAVEVIRPAVELLPQSGRMQQMLLEALRGAGRGQEAQDLVDQMNAMYQGRKIAKTESLSFAVELAWFYLIGLGRPDMALSVLEPYKTSPLSREQALQRFLGAAELAAEDPDVVQMGVQRLSNLAAQDAYSAAFLAQYYFRNGQAAAGRRVLDGASELPRSGEGLRLLRKVGEENGVALPPTLPGATDVSEIVGKMNEAYLEMGHAPEKYLEVLLEPVAPEVPLADAVEIRATIRNIGPVPIPLVQPERAFFNPQMTLTAEVFERSGASRRFDELPVVRWRAPRYLPAGDSLTTTVRLDVAALGEYLFDHPLESLTLRIQGTLSPRQADEQIVSALPTLQVRPTEVTRLGLLNSFDGQGGSDRPAAYRTATTHLYKDSQVGPLARRMRAARQTVALLGLTRQVERSRAVLPADLVSLVDKGALLERVGQLLRDPSPAVRAQTVDALGSVKLDESILKRLGPVVEDPSPLVRLLMAELIGASRTAGRETLVDYYAGDEDELVQAMARALQGKSGIGR